MKCGFFFKVLGIQAGWRGKVIDVAVFLCFDFLNFVLWKSTTYAPSPLSTLN
jgi:hypothetical protein